MAKRYKESKLMPALALSALLVTVLLVVPVAALKDITSYVAYPLAYVGSWLIQKREERFTAHKTKDTMQHELRDAAAKIAQLELRVHELEQSESLYHDIQELVDFRKRFGAVYSLIAPVARRDLSVARQHILIDSGLTSGVKVGMVALADHRLLGRVTEVYPLYSIVSLITDPSVSVAAIGATSKTTGVIRGTGNKQRVQLAYVDHLSPLVVGEQIVSSGEGLLFPRGFLIGTLASDEVNGIYHTALVDLAVDLAHLTHVLLISPVDCKPCISVPKQTVADSMTIPVIAPIKPSLKKERIVQQDAPREHGEQKPTSVLQTVQENHAEQHVVPAQTVVFEPEVSASREVMVPLDTAVEENVIQNA